MNRHAAPRFSIVIIARNEEHTLPRLFATLDDFVHRNGDVVIVDTGSSDGTTRVANELGCRVAKAGSRFDAILNLVQARDINALFAKAGEGPLVSSGERLFHFAKAREYATSLARNELVLHLDASDELLALDIDALNEQISIGEVNSFGYWREYLSADCDQSSISYFQSRFYDRRVYHWEGYTHEAIYPNDSSPPSFLRSFRCTKEQLFERHIKDEKKARLYNLASLALDLMGDPANPRWKHYLGRELYYFGWHKSAIALLEDCAAMQNAWSPERSESLCLAGSCYEALREPGQAIQCYSRAFSIDGTRREPLLKLATLSCKQSDFRGGVEYASAALEIPRTSTYFEFDVNYSYVPHAILYWSLFWLGRKQQARRHWELCVQLAPNNPQFREHAKLFDPERKTNPKRLKADP